MDPDGVFMDFGDMAAGYTTLSDSFKLFNNSFSKSAWANANREPHEPHPDVNFTTKHPRKGYIDGGIVLADSFTVSREEMEMASTADWNDISHWADGMSNISCDEILKDRLLHFYDKPPCITSMA